MLIQELSLSQEALARPKGPNSFFRPPCWHGMLPSMQRGSKGRALMTPDFVGPLPSDHISHKPLSPYSWLLWRRKEDRLRDSVFYAGEPEHYLKELFKILDRTLNWIEHWLFFPPDFLFYFSQQLMVSMGRTVQPQSEEATSYLHTWIIMLQLQC